MRNSKIARSDERASGGPKFPSFIFTPAERILLIFLLG